MTTSTPVSTSSSVNSSATDDGSSTRRDSCYFPGCRKDANCKCEICLASINATLDLMSSFSSLTKLSHQRPKQTNINIEKTPVLFKNASGLSTPVSKTPTVPGDLGASPAVKSTARTSLCRKTEETKEAQMRKPCVKGKRLGIGTFLVRVMVGLCSVLLGEVGFSCLVSVGLVNKSVLKSDVVRSIGESSLSLGGELNGRVGFVENELKDVVGENVGNCSTVDSLWNVQQDGLLLVSRCTLYKSMAEEVCIWGWPLQTAGLLASGFSSRSYTVISGRVTEWADGKVGYVVRTANSSWVLRKWGASAVQLNPNTWILEYRQSSILENSRLFSAALDFLTYRISRVVKRIKHKFWLSSATRWHSGDLRSSCNVKIPT